MAPTAASNVHTATNVTGSVARTLNNIPPSTFVKASDTGHAEHEPGKHQLHPVPDNQFQHVAQLSPEGHAQAELARALRDEIRHHTVESDDRERERGAGKNREQRHRESLPADRARHALLQQREIGEGKLRVQRGHPLPDGAATSIVAAERPRTARNIERMGCCKTGTQICNRGSLSSCRCLMSANTPTTSLSSPPSPRRFPRGLSPGQIRCASVSLTTATGGEPIRSRSLNARPCVMRIRSARK